MRKLLHIALLIIAPGLLFENQGLLQMPLMGEAATGDTLPVAGSTQIRRFHTLKGKVRIEGTSNLDDWQVESTSLNLSLEAGAAMPTEPGQPAPIGQLNAGA